ncbi:MAG TPA: hypothetical protein VN231_02375 [Allosphingosinicella sp.]|nr:hypothetical protein [Allosphingosinicella sp.]
MVIAKPPDSGFGLFCKSTLLKLSSPWPAATSTKTIPQVAPHCASALRAAVFSVAVKASKVAPASGAKPALPSTT